MKNIEKIILLSLVAFVLSGCGSGNDDVGCCSDSSVITSELSVAEDKQSDVNSNNSVQSYVSAQTTLFATSSYEEDMKSLEEDDKKIPILDLLEEDKKKLNNEENDLGLLASNKIVLVDNEVDNSPLLGELSVEEDTYDNFLVVPQEEFYGNIVPTLTENSVDNNDTNKSNENNETNEFTEDNETTPLSDELSVVKDAEKLDLPKCTITDIELPESGKNDTTITWESNHEEVLDNYGVVTRPTKCEDDVHVVLVATISKGDVKVQKEFFVGVIKEMGSDEESAKRDGDIIRYFLPREISEDKITLAENGLNGSFVTWESSNEDVIALDGTVTAQDEDSEVTLTLTVTNNGATNVSSVDVVVKAK